MSRRNHKSSIGRSMVVALLATLMLAQLAFATHMVPLRTPGNLSNQYGAPDRGRFDWINSGTSGTFLYWYVYVSWSDQRLWQRDQGPADPQIEMEGYNPGGHSDCDNINHYQVFATLPNDLISAKNASACPGDNASIKELLEIHVKANHGEVQANTNYYVRWLVTKTYLRDQFPDWQEVNLTWEEWGTDWWQGKLKYDIRGSANGGQYVTNGQYVASCVQPTDALHIQTCPP